MTTNDDPKDAVVQAAREATWRIVMLGDPGNDRTFDQCSDALYAAHCTARAALAALDATPPAPAAGMVEVRVAVAVNAAGDWSAKGIYCWNDERSADVAGNSLEGIPSISIITASVPLPVVAEIAGRVATPAEREA